MVERRGRPSEQPAVALDKWELESYTAMMLEASGIRG